MRALPPLGICARQKVNCPLLPRPAPAATSAQFAWAFLPGMPAPCPLLPAEGLPACFDLRPQFVGRNGEHLMVERHLHDISPGNEVVSPERTARRSHAYRNV